MMALVSLIVTTSCGCTMTGRYGLLHEAPLRAASLLSARNQYCRSLQKTWDAGIKIEPTPNPG
ncbi:MAG: hypothetical protein IJN55_03925 [Alistipes sp.]|nr:hypothetical protein [Rikenellaceae bacterium]MBQ6881698.1 hypothetical protein [Alistipes sp.]MBR1994887.1 hypothetical protein [Alistipes sp.]MBR3847228.1 hypothetical protein [Alistipes sp.]MBR7169108.1 hypothetical protein [Alistipes sp.]